MVRNYVVRAGSQQHEASIPVHRICSTFSTMAASERANKHARLRKSSVSLDGRMNISQLPLASVLSDNYMRGRPLARRTYSTLQVIVVGDGSTDNSPQAIASCRNRII